MSLLRISVSAAAVLTAVPLTPHIALAGEKVDVCHITGDGSYRLINISENAVQAHLAHGDVAPGTILGTNLVENDCSLTELVRVESPPLSFGATGWGGWSCPPEFPDVVGGGYEPSTHVVTVSEAAEPGSDSGFYPSYPHYTFGTGEEGWVVQNGGVPATLTVYALCAAE